MSLRRKHQHGFSHGQVLRLGTAFLAVGLVLFLFVWWPIQAERAALRLGEWEEKLALKKAELNTLKSRYAQLTSLHVLDKWASAHGPWRSPKSDDVILLPS
jgi:hypothetical protein